MAIFDKESRLGAGHATQAGNGHRPPLDPNTRRAIYGRIRSMDEAPPSPLWRWIFGHN
jgi:hypothetical protein